MGWFTNCVRKSKWVNGLKFEKDYKLYSTKSHTYLKIKAVI